MGKVEVFKNAKISTKYYKLKRERERGSNQKYAINLQKLTLKNNRSLIYLIKNLKEPS